MEQLGKQPYPAVMRWPVPGQTQLTAPTSSPVSAGPCLAIPGNEAEHAVSSHVSKAKK